MVEKRVGKLTDTSTEMVWSLGQRKKRLWENEHDTEANIKKVKYLYHRNTRRKEERVPCNRILRNNGLTLLKFLKRIKHTH